MTLRYIKADPTGNITALVESPIAENRRAEAAAAIFAGDSSIEQLGFLSETAAGDIRLDMAGGEFCGNACLCAAAYHLRRCGGERGRVLVSISGADAPVPVEMQRLSENEYSGSVEMPLPLSIDTEGANPVVNFPGISHVIIPYDTPASIAEALIRPMCAGLGADALGLMLFDEAASHLRPLVYVPGADTLCWERSCASGSCAVSAYLAHREAKDVSRSLSLPGGSLFAAAEYSEGRITGLRLGGKVRLGQAKDMEI